MLHSPVRLLAPVKRFARLGKLNAVHHHIRYDCKFYSAHVLAWAMPSLVEQYP
jgi:hypothetical protein